MYTEEQKRQHIRNLQSNLRLVALTEKLVPVPPIDGLFGSTTSEALRVFQRKYRLPVTGVADYITWEAVAARANQALLNQAAFADIYIAPYEQGNAVYGVQTLLNGLSPFFVNLKPVPYTGILDFDTQQTLRTFQRAAGLPQTGAVDAKTLRLLLRLFTAVSGTVPIGWQLAEER